MSVAKTATIVSVERRNSDRFESGRPAAMGRLGMKPTSAVIDNISSDGACIRSSLELDVDAIIRVSLPRGLILQARVIWCRDGKIGCAFLIPLAVHDLVLALDPW